MRITIERTVYGKLSTQLQKEDNADVKRLLAQCKTTQSPTKDTILWAPSPDLLAGILRVLERELTFMRKPDSATYKRMEETIRRLKASQNGS